jgi:TrpR-related protein YerC/YecD
MANATPLIWENKIAQQFASALVAINDPNLMMNFLRDVMTEKEIIEISARLEAARMLQAGYKYTDIVTKTKLSSRTVARISDWMKNGCDGYANILGQMKHHDHIPPARAE